MKAILILSIFCLALSQVNPPVWPNIFSQDFVESYSATKFVTVGKIYYDWGQQAMKITRREGKYEGICSSVYAGSGPCEQLVYNKKRYVIHPVQQMCCECCDADHGCGMLKKDWLKDAKFEGTDSLSGAIFNKFSIPDGSQMDYYWASLDSANIPRRIAQVDSRFKDFIMNTYSEVPFEKSALELPLYCKGAICPATSVCQKFRETKKNIAMEE